MNITLVGGPADGIVARVAGMWPPDQKLYYWAQDSKYSYQVIDDSAYCIEDGTYEGYMSPGAETDW